MTEGIREMNALSTFAASHASLCGTVPVPARVEVRLARDMAEMRAAQRLRMLPWRGKAEYLDQHAVDGEWPCLQPPLVDSCHGYVDYILSVWRFSARSRAAKKRLGRFRLLWGRRLRFQVTPHPRSTS